MKNRRTFGGGNGGIWMLRKRRKITAVKPNQYSSELSDPTNEKRIKISLPVNATPRDTTVSICPSDDDDFFHPGDEALSPNDTIAEQTSAILITTTTERQHQKLGSKQLGGGGPKRGTFGSRKRSMLTDSEISKQIRIALSSQSSLSQVSSDEEEHSSHCTRKLLCDSEDDDDDSTPVSLAVDGQEQKAYIQSSQESKNSNLTFREGKQKILHPSLEAAKRFFAEIDNVPLITEAADNNPSAKKTFKLRTRRCKLPKQALESEYAKYCEACGEIKPLSIECFVEQRAKYFRRSEVFEGMFDE